MGREYREIYEEAKEALLKTGMIPQKTSLL
jgi:hypothetical protein